MLKKPSITIDARMINASGVGTVIKNVLPIFEASFDVTLMGNKQALSEITSRYPRYKILHTNASIYSIRTGLNPLFFSKSDVLWVPHFNVPLFYRCKKMVVTIHDTYHLDYWEEMSVVKKIYAKFFYYRAVKKADVVFVVSNFTRDKIFSYYPNIDKKKFFVTHLGVNDAFFPLPNPKRNYILYVGNVKPHKNLGVLLEAFHTLEKSIQSTFPLYIVGKKEGFITESNFSEHVKNIIRQNKNIVFTGRVTDETLVTYYQNAKMLIMPSLYEGFGLPPLEAMKTKTPVICSSIPVFKELYKDTVLYFNPHSSEDLKTKITLLIYDSELREALIQKGLKNLELYTWENCKNTYKKQIDSLLHEKSLST